MATGTPGNDNLSGTAGNDSIEGLAGDDFLGGGGGDDTLRGGSGNDFLHGGDGNDLLDGGDGWDWVFYDEAVGPVTIDLTLGLVTGGAGTDTLVGVEWAGGSAYADLIIGNSGDNVLQGRGGDDTLYGGDGWDTLDYFQATGGVQIHVGLGQTFGADGHDFFSGFESFTGSVHDDSFFGDGANNNFAGLAGNDYIDGGGGFDGVSYWDATSGVTANLAQQLATGGSGTDTLVGIENIGGSFWDDSLVGDDGHNGLEGRAGNDLLDGAGGWDWIAYWGATGGVTVDLANHTATDGLGGTDTIYGIEFIYGSSQGDQLTGDAGNNGIDGREGDDVMNGGGGIDNADYFAATGGVNVSLASNQASGAWGNDILSGFENVIGSNHADTLTGDGGDNFLQGNGGNDSISAGSGNDNVVGGGGNDTLDGGAGFDQLAYFDANGGVFVNLQAGTVSGAAGDDLISGFENVQGSTAADVLIGDGAGNALFGDAGNDNLLANGGDDFLIGGAGDDAIDGGANGTFGDTVSYFTSTSGVNVNLGTGVVSSDGLGGQDTVLRVEHVEGSRYDDVLVGDNTNTNWFRPHGGNDAVDGLGGQDVVMYEESTAGVTIDLRAGYASGSAIGYDLLTSIESAHASRHDDVVQLSDSQGYVFGRSGDDRLTGGLGNDNFIGGSGSDTIDGGAGADNADYGDDGFDLVPITGVGVTVNLQLGRATDNWGHTDFLSNIENVRGSRYADLIIGSDAMRNEFFNGDGGDDTLQGGGGNDAFVGGAGDDVIRGGAITDLVNYTDLNNVDYSSATTSVRINLQTGVVQDGLGGVDTLSDINFVNASRFDDSITGSNGIYFEQFDGGLGNDTIDGGAINALTFANSNRVTYFSATGAVNVNLATGTATGAAGNDRLVNINHLFGSRFADTLTGSNSAITESFNGRGGNDTIDGAGGIDEVRYTNAVTAVNVNLATGVATDGEFVNGAQGVDRLASIEGVRGSNFNDVLTGGNAAGDELEFFVGMAGSDTIDGGSGYDRADYVTSTTAVTVTLGGTGTGTAVDGFVGSNGPCVDTLINIEGVRGSSFNDVLTGSDSGAFESFEGREGNDTIDGRGGIDRADYTSTAGAINVNLAMGTAADGYGGTDTLANIENVRGGAYDDRITGNAGANLLQGNAGNDTVAGGEGDDSVAGGLGNDVLTGGAGLDQFLYLSSGNGLDTITDFVHGDTLLVGGLITGQSAAGNGTGVLAGQMQVSTASGVTTLHIGTDAIAGADVQIRFNGSFAASDFIALGSAEGYTAIGLIDSPKRVAELAVQREATSNANADVGGKVAGHSTSNPVAVANMLEALDRFQVGNAAGGDFAGLVADAGGPVDLVGLPPLVIGL